MAASRRTQRFERSYRWFRDRGHTAQEAWRYAAAEAFAEEKGWQVVTEPEQERYVDVYGEEPPPNTDFVTVAVVDENGHWLANVGFVEDDRERVRVEGANEILQSISMKNLDGVFRRFAGGAAKVAGDVERRRRARRAERPRDRSYR